MNYDITLNSRKFLLDTSEDSGFVGPISVPLLRNQADTAGRPGEGALNREDAWRRVWMSWHHGAGQRVNDVEGDSDPFRYWESSGINPWEKNQVSLLHTVDEILDWGRVSATPSVLVTQDLTNEVLIVNDGDVRVAVIVAGSDTGYPVDSGDFTAITASQSIHDIATDGVYIYATDGDDVFRFLAGDATVGSSWDTLDCIRLWYVMGRLLAAGGPDLYNITSPPTSVALFSHGNPDFEWTGVSAASGFIYAVGHTPTLWPTIEQLYRGQSEIYRIGLLDDGTGLDVPIPCATLPDGEIAQAILGYAGFVLVGTNKGVRLAQPDANGNLDFGRSIPIGSVWSLSGHDRFVWAGIATEDDNSKLWRLDLSEFTSPLTPAYAEDLVSLTSTVNRSRVSSIARFGEKTVYIEAKDTPGLMGTELNEVSLFFESDTYRTDAYIDLGQVTFGFTDDKTALSGEARYEPVPAGAVLPNPFELQAFWDYVSSADPVTTSDTIAEGSSVTHFDDGSVIGEVHSSARLKLDVNVYEDSNPDQIGSPVLTSFTFRARPTPSRALEYHLPILLADRYTYDTGGAEGRSIAADLAFVTALAVGGSCTLNIFGADVVGFVEDFQYQPFKKSGRKSQAQQFDGVLNVKFKVVS